MARPFLARLVALCSITAGIAVSLTGPAAASPPLSYVFSEDFLTVRFDSYGPAANELTVVEGNGVITLHDPLTSIVPGEGCVATDGASHTVVCEGLTSIVNLWGGNDVLDATATRGVIGDLGDGDDVAYGGRERDSLSGGRGSDLLSGGPGGDSLAGDPGADEIVGGPGFDLALYNLYKVPVTADLDAETGDDGAAGEGDTIRTDVEGLVGGFANDTLTGGSGPNWLLGANGDDLLSVRDGVGGDSVDGGLGKDVCLTDPGDVRVSC
ncbi:calcium-binding protein [Tenggerimyces flavus]|uniref:Calcium-binding protein n=1 Tax=Tenggerimyces flavus TaxID=1708749 RepID=A0ABV7YM67_9ACTN|nr:calcium-binding protein [Tenggerimyces flavus]MBM7787335.1 Ca2+-binding RTX toxin-like protein [Tenggerimyces flavus]